MAKRKNSQEPENRPATGKTPKRSREPKKAAAGAAPEPVKEEPTGDLKSKLMGITIEPPEPEDDPAAAELALKEAQEKLARAFYNPAAEAVERQQQALNQLLGTARAALETSTAFAAVTRDLARAAAASLTDALGSFDVKGALGTASVMQEYFRSQEWEQLRQNMEILAAVAREINGLTPYLEEELKKPEYNGATVDEVLDALDINEAGEITGDPLFIQAIDAARAARDARAIIEAQNTGRERRRQTRENAEKSGAIMELREGALPVFSDRGLWDAFAPGRISKLGELARDRIDKQTGRLNNRNISDDEIIELPAADIAYKVFMLLNAILANSVENFREYFIPDGSIKFYVKGVLDKLDIDPRIRDDMQLNFDRKTAGVLYLEKRFEPILSYIGTTPDGSRYSVLNYDGYDVESDTMTIRTPYLYQLWLATQEPYFKRQEARALRIASGKKPLKSDLKPLELNTLFKGAAFKEDDSVLEIAVYITTVMLNAGKGAHRTEISYKKLIKNCSRLREKLEELESLPNTEKLADGKKCNNSARYNTELRKIARAYSLIMNPEKCDALKIFKFISVTPTTGEKDSEGKPLPPEKQRFIPPTKREIAYKKIYINWRRIDRENG